MERKLKTIKCLMQDGTRTKIDLSFYPIYCQYTWYVNSDGYVATSIKKNGKYITIFLAHLVIGFDPSIDKTLSCDHKNRIRDDNRSKNLRIVDKSTQTKNRIRETNTGVPLIHHDKEEKRYRVTYTINNVRYREDFSYGVRSDKYQYNAWVDAKSFRENLLTTEPEYIKAFSKDDDVSSDGDSIDEEKYLNNPNFERLSKQNTSKHKYISIDNTRKRYILSYFNEYGEKKIEYFPFGPRSLDNQKTALDKAVEFKWKYEKYRPKRDLISKKCDKIKKDLISSSEDTSNESNENSNIEEMDCSSNSDTLTMSEDEIENELVKIKNSAPIPSIYKGVDLDLDHNRYTVTYFDGYTHVRYFGFGINEKYDHWMAARVVAESFKDEIDKIL